MNKQHLPISEYQTYLSENPTFGTYFKPEPPFAMYTRGVVWYNKSWDRRCVTLRTPTMDNSEMVMLPNSMLVSRYLYAVKLYKESGLLIPEGYEVDHRDDNKWNDTYDNFQLLTQADNIRKALAIRNYNYLNYVVICPVCLKQFETPFHSSKLRKGRPNEILYCSMRCQILFKSTLSPYKDFISLRQWIAEKQRYQLIRRRTHKQQEEIDIVCEEMLTFDLATACGRPIMYDTPQLLSPIEQHKLASKLRRDGLSWSDIGARFNTVTSVVYNNFKDVPLTDNLDIWNDYTSQLVDAEYLYKTIK